MTLIIITIVEQKQKCVGFLIENHNKSQVVWHFCVAVRAICVRNVSNKMHRERMEICEMKSTGV